MEPYPCSYLPGRQAQTRGIWAYSIDPEVMEAFLEAGFRRSGSVIYQPVCAGCRACRSLKVDVDAFVPSTSQRRVARRNADLRIEIGPPELTDAKVDLYARYLVGQHQSADSVQREDLERFLYVSPCPTTLEFCYFDPTGELIGVGICDVTPTALSSVYFYWEPKVHRRSLGIFSALTEIRSAIKLGLQWYHMGYWVNSSATMHYKATFSDHFLLDADGQWRFYPRNKS